MCRRANGHWYTRRMARLLLACAATVLPAVSFAATTDVSVDDFNGNLTLVIGASAGSGTANRITLNQNGTQYRVTEGPNSTIVAGPGCTKEFGANAVNCTFFNVFRAQVALWDGADIFEDNTQLFTLVFAGDGNDQITTGCGADTVFGEGGNDTIIDQGLCGGFGLSCEPGFTNCLHGGPGDDTLKGPLANSPDHLIGDAGTDKLFGRGGNDFLQALDGVSGETVDCGPGTDTVEKDVGDTGAGCNP